MIEEMKERFHDFDLSGKIIAVSTIIAILSLFMTWADIGIARVSGFQQQAFLLLIPFIYPALHTVKELDMNRIIGAACGVISVIFCFVYISQKKIDFFGETVNAASTGVYVFMLCSVGIIVGSLMSSSEY